MARASCGRKYPTLPSRIPNFSAPDRTRLSHLHIRTFPVALVQDSPSPAFLFTGDACWNWNGH